MKYADKWFVCVDCGRQFMWDAGEQAWFEDKHLMNPPKRCKGCRDRRRDEQLHQPRQYFKVRCDSCGTEAFVPFVPQGIKPVYCRSCLTARV
jgi:CxxC-x17-CxxC domain-containing protein